MIRGIFALVVFMMMMSVFGGDPYGEAMKTGQKNEQAMKWTEAAGNYKTAIELVKDNSKKANALLRLALCCRKEQKKDEALKIYAQISGFNDISPDFKSQSLLGQAQILMEDRKFIDCVVEYKKVLAIKNAPPYRYNEAQLNIGRALMQLKSYDESIAAYEKLLTMNPDPGMAASALIDIGRCQFSQKKYDVAVASYEKAATVENIPLSLLNLAQDKICDIAYFYKCHKDTEKAIATYEKLLGMELTPDRACSYGNAVGDCLYEQEKYDAAIRACNNAFKVERANIVARSRSQIIIGNSQIMLKRYSNAIDSFEKAIDIGELNDSRVLADVCLQMGRCYSLLKNDYRAKKEYKRILDMKNAGDDQQSAAKERLKNIDGGDHNKKRRKND